MHIEEIVVVSLEIVCICFVILILLPYIIPEIKKIKQQYKIIREKKKTNIPVRKGEWLFPKLEFYSYCKDNSITEINGDFARRKARVLMEDFLHERGISAVNQAHYTNSLEVLFDEGKKLYDEKQAEKRQREDDYNFSVHNAQLTPEQMKTYALNKYLGMCYGVEKRIVMLKAKISYYGECRKEAFKKMQNYKNDSKLTMQVNKMTLEKKGDWAVRGGIADAIAGPGAGIATALKTMAYNEAIDQRNAERNRNAYTAADYFDRQARMENGNVNYYVNKIKETEAEIEKTKKKIIMDSVDQKDIYSKLIIGRATCKEEENHALKISVNVTNNYPLDYQDGIKVVVDGSIKANIYDGNTYVGTTTIVLPIYGLGYNEKKEIEAYCNTYIGKSKEYKVSFEPNKLWIMEL